MELTQCEYKVMKRKIWHFESLKANSEHSQNIIQKQESGAAMVILQIKTKHIRPDLSRKPSLEKAFAQFMLAGKVIWVHLKLYFISVDFILFYFKT